MQIIPVWGQSECMFSSVPQKLNSGTSNNKNLQHIKKLSITKSSLQSPSLIEKTTKPTLYSLKAKHSGIKHQIQNLTPRTKTKHFPRKIRAKLKTFYKKSKKNDWPKIHFNIAASLCFKLSAKSAFAASSDCFFSSNVNIPFIYTNSGNENINKISTKKPPFYFKF